MDARLPREMLAAVVRDLSVPVSPAVVVEALNYASAQLAGYYAWPWFLSEMTWTFPAPITGTATATGTQVTLVSTSGSTSSVDKNWRVQIGTYDYPVDTLLGSVINVDISKTRIYPVADPAAYTLYQSSLTMPPDFIPGKDITCYNTQMRYRVRHVSRQAFERHWQSYKQMASNMPIIYTEREPFLDTSPGGGWRHQLQFCPRMTSNTQVRIAYYRNPAPIDPVDNQPSEWPTGYDEVIELLALGRLGEKLGDKQAMLGGRRAQGLIRQLRGGVATAAMDSTPQQNSPFGEAFWEQGGLSVLPRES